MIVVSVLTIFEFGYNAYLSQVTFGYDDVHKFADATVSVKRVTDNIQENADQNSIGLPQILPIPEQFLPWCPIRV